MASQNHAVIDLTGDFPPPEPQDPELGSHEDLEADIGHSLALRPASRDQRQVGRLTAQQSETNSPQQLVTQGQSLISHFFRPRQTTAVGVAGSAQVLVPALGRHQASILGLGLPSAVPGVFGPREARLSGPDPNPAEVCEVGRHQTLVPGLGLPPTPDFPIGNRPALIPGNSLRLADLPTVALQQALASDVVPHQSRCALVPDVGSRPVGEGPRNPIVIDRDGDESAAVENIDMQTRKILKPRSIQTCRYPLRSRSDQQQQEQVQGQRRRQQNLVPAQIATFESSEGDWCKSTHSPVGDGYIQPQVQPQRQYVPVEPQSQQVQTNKNGSGETRQVPLDPQGFVPSKNGRDPSRLQRKRRRGEGRKFRENAPAPDISRTSGQKRSRDESSLAEESQIQADPRPAKSARTTLHAAPFQGLRHDVGFLGETEVYERFKSVLGDDWDYRNWTSHFRADAGYPEFIESEMGIADFTFTDEHGKMKSYLVSQGFGPDPKWSNKTTFHLEVKTTLKNKTGYKLSRSQRELREIARRDPNMVFLVVRMYDIEGQSGARWAFYFNDEMG